MEDIQSGGSSGTQVAPLASAGDIQSRILTIRGVQVMLDRDLAEVYNVQTKVLNQAVKRNMERFPKRFMFQLNKVEFENWRSQIVTSNSRDQEIDGLVMGLRRAPYAFTEQGIAMLSAVLRSMTAVQVSVRIMDAFVAMRRTLASMAPMLTRLEVVERRQITDQSRNEARFERIFDAMNAKTFPAQKIFYDGEVFDADAFATKHILSATQSILLIDSWVDVTTLEMLAKKSQGVSVEIVTSPRGNKLSAADISKFNAQYGGLTVKTSTRFHDRFLIVDDRHLYLFGASLKDLGRKCFAFTKLDSREIPSLKARVTSSSL